MAEDATRPKVGLALGGGGALGWAHIGVIRTLTEEGVPIDMIAGTSIGAIVGAAFLAGRLDTLEAMAREINWRGMLSLADFKGRWRGLVGGSAIARVLSENLAIERIEDLPKPFVAVAADLIKGEEVHFSSGSLVDAIRASISIPGVFKPHHYQGRLLVDGGVLNPLPVQAVRDVGADFVIAIDVINDYEGRAYAAGFSHASVANGNMTAEPMKAGRKHGSLTGVAKRIFAPGDKGPNIVSVVINSASLLTRELSNARLALSPADVYIAPKVGHVSPVEFGRVDELVELGRTAAAEALPAILARAAWPTEPSRISVPSS